MENLTETEQKYLDLVQKCAATGEPLTGSDCETFLTIRKQLSDDFVIKAHNLMPDSTVTEGDEKSISVNEDQQTLTQTDKEETNMNAPTTPAELKTIEMVIEKEIPLMDQIKAALPALNAGQSFRTEIKAVSGPNTAATTGAQIGIPAQFAGLVQTTLPAPNRLYSLINKLPAYGQAVSYVQVALADNKAAKVKELGLKPQSELSSVTKTVTIETFAHHTAASKQIISDVSGLQSVIGSTLVTGLLNVVDAYLYETLTANASVFTPTLTGADILAEATLKIQQAGGNNVQVLINPSDYLALMTAKTSGSGEYLGMAPLPISVTPCASVAAGSLLAFDTSAAVVFERETVGVFAGYAGNQFIENQISLLVEMRTAGAVLNPNLVLTGLISTPKAK